jgi:hypothetical protein
MITTNSRAESPKMKGDIGFGWIRRFLISTSLIFPIARKLKYFERISRIFVSQTDPRD